MSEKSRQFLHGEFVKAGLNVGTAEEFDSLMVNNAESRNWALQQAERLGFDTTDFERKMTEVTITPTNENVVVSDTTKPTDTPAQILARTIEKATSNNGGKLMAMPVTNLDQWKQEADIKARQAVEDGKASPVMYADNPDLTEAELKQSASPYAQNFAKEAERMLGVGNKAFAGNYYEDTDPLTGKKSYFDVLLNQHTAPFAAMQSSNDIVTPINNQLKAKRDYINSLDQRIADTENKIKEVQAEQAKKTSNANKGASAFMPASARAITETQTAEQLAPQETEELKQLHATLNDLHDMKTTVQAQNELTKSDGFFDWNNAKNIWRGLSDTFTDPYFYSSFLSFGATDLTDAQTKAKVFDKIDKGQDLTDTEMQLALASGMADDIKSSADLPIGYTGAKIAGESLPFVLQMALNPASGLAKTAAKAAVRKVGRSGLWAVTARVGARALGATAEGAILANTIQAGATAADIIDRKTGKVKLGFDENGYLIPTEIDDKKSWGQAIYEGEASKIIENATELMGLPGMGKLTKATAKGLEKLGLKNVRKTINTLSRSKMSQFLEKAGWHGPLGEIFEEEAGMFFNIVAQVGDNKWSDFYDIKKQSEIALGCSLFGGVVSVYTTTSAATSLALDAKAERKIKSTDAIAKGRLTESRWLPIKEEFDNALDSEREEMVGRIMSDTKFTPQEKKAVLDYFAAAVYWEGRNQAKAITALESKPTPTQRAINATEEAYQQGMLADNPSDQYDAMEQLRTAEQKVRDFFGWDESVDVDDEIKSYFGTSETSELLNQLQDYTEDVQDLFADYLFARTKYDGVIEGQAQRVDAGVAELTERLSAESHAARQEMVSATLPDGTACTIIGGNFDVKDGVIDLANSDQTVVIMQDGQKRMVSADQVSDISLMPIEQVINEQVTAYRHQADTEFENGINLVAQSRQQAEAAEQQQAQEEAPQAEEQTTEVAEAEQQPSIPVDAQGNPLYEQATTAQAVQDIYNNQGLPSQIADQFVANKLAEAKKYAEKLAKKEPQIGTNIAQYKEAMAQWQQDQATAQANVAFWEEVQQLASQVTIIAEEQPKTELTEEVAEEQPEAQPTAEETPATQTPAETTAEEAPVIEAPQVEQPQTTVAQSSTAKGKKGRKPTKQNTQPRNQKAIITQMANKYGLPSDVHMFVLYSLALGGRKLRWKDNPRNKTKGLASHLGLNGSRTEFASRLWMLNANDGYYPEVLAEKIAEDYASAFTSSGLVSDLNINTMDFFNAMLDVLRSTTKQSQMLDDLMEYYQGMESANNDIDAQWEAWARAQAEDEAYRRGFASLEEMEAYEEMVAEEMEKSQLTDAEYENYNNFVAEERIREDYERNQQQTTPRNEPGGTSGVRQESTEILSGQQFDNPRGNSTASTNAQEVDGANNNADGNAPNGQNLNEAQPQAEFQQTADEIVADTPAAQLATEATIKALTDSGIEIVEATDAMAEAVLGNSAEMMAKKKRALETVSVQETEHQQTAISSADGAKILNNLDNLAEEYVKNPKTEEKTFIGVVANALGIDAQGKSSKYATFEAKNGKVVTIRLSNHNAKVSNFDNNEETEGISIVVSAKGNNGITNDGDAHIVEHYYDAIKLRRAEGKPLADIVRSIKQALYSGVFNDPTGLAERQEVNLNEVENLTTPQGTVYGWTDGKRIYLTREGLNPETPVHEYTHLWARAMMQNNAEGWLSVKDLLRDTPVWNEVVNDDNYANIRGDEDAIASEALSRLSGKNGAQKMTDMAQQLINEGNPQAQTLIGRIRQALQDFWRWVGVNLFDIKEFESIEEITDRVLWDMVSGTDLGSLSPNQNELMIIGEKGATELDRAEEATHRMDNLNIAREMETAGKDAKVIRMATGWERGADGKWRYEIPDFDVLLPSRKAVEEAYNEAVKEENNAQSKWQAKSYRNSLLPRASKKNTQEENDEIRKQRKEANKEEKSLFAFLTKIRDYRLKLENQLRDGLYHKLPEIISPDSEIFKSYPQLKGTTITIAPSGRYLGTANYRGSYNAETNSIYLGWDLSEREMKSVLLHEVQHAIQHIEGFAQGGSPAQFAVPEPATDFERAVNELNEFLPATHGDTPHAKIEALLFSPRLDAFRNTLVSPNAQESIATLQRLFKEWSEEQFMSEWAYTLDRYADSQTSPITKYRRLGGEVESRNVQKRMDMSDEQRRETLLAETEDVAREDQIFLMGNARESAMIMGDIDINPLLNVVRILYSMGKEVASRLFSMKFFDVAKTPNFMKPLGLRGDKFTIRYGVISRHIGKDGSHDLSERDWEQLPNALQTPFAITKLNDEKDSYRIYTTLQTEKKEYVVVGVDVKNAGRNLEVNAISTAFGRRNNANLPMDEDVIYTDTNITPEQSALLERPNFAQYPTNQELSADEVTNNSSNTQEDSELFRPEDRNAEWTEGINPELQEKYGKKNRYKMWQGRGQITQDNVASALYVESGIYSNELRKLPKLFATNEGRLVDPQATILGAQQRIEILNEYKAMIAEEMMPKATKPAQEYMQKEIDRLDETIDYLNDVVANPEAMARDSRRIGNSYLLRPEEEENTTDTFTSVAQSAADRLGIEIEIDESMPAKGSYNPRTGRIRINPSRHATAEDVQRTVLHETIGHGGIQAVAGKRFGQVCQQVYDMMSEEQRADIRSRHGNLSDEAVGAEYMAEMAEKGKVDITTWEKVKAMVRNMLMSMGISLNLTDADIRYMLYSAHQLAEKGKLQDAISRATTLGKLRRQAELSHDVAEDAMSRPLMRPIDPDLIELTTGELGLTDVQVIDADTLEKMFDSTKLAKANKHSIFTQFKNNFVDRTRPIAKFIQQVYGLKNIGEAYVWDPESNPHIGANLAPSKAMRRTQVFRKGKMKDLLDTYNNLWMEWRKAHRGFGVEYAQAMARLYAIAKTAQERQAIKGKGSKDTDFAGVAGVLKWIGMTVKVHNGKFLKPINWETEASILGKDHDELTIAECEAILAQHGHPSMQEFISQYEKDVNTSAFWNQTQAISHDMLRNQLEAGLLSPSSYQILMYGKSFVEIAKAKGVTDANMLMSMVTMTDSQQLVDLGIITQDEADALTPYYQHYLPLKDSTDIEQTDVVDYGGNRKVEGSKRAVQSVTGHSNMVGDPIARLCYDYTVAIHNEEENRWKLQLLDIVRYHQSTTPPKKRMAVATSRKYINGLIGAFDEVRINPHAMSEHEVAVFENGSQVVIRFADKSIAEAVNPEKVKVGKFLRFLNWANRFLANAYTSKNPAFVVPNVIRDYQAGFQYNLAKGKKQWMVYNKMMANARSRQALYDLLINREDHSAWGNTKYADYVQEFLDNGGPTAVNSMASLDDIQDELNKTAKAINEAKTPLSGLKKGARATTEWLGRMGEMAELTTRLATYIAARECGKSVSLAALEAKEVSVNFDRKGKASIRKYFPIFSIFQNAALQSLRREWGLMREAPLTYAAYRLIKPAMHVGLSIYVGMIINGIDGDDEEAVKEYLLNYFSVNSHTASANFLIPTPWGTSFSIPAAIDDMGFNKLAFLITKRVMLNSITGHAYNAEESVWDDVIEVVSQFADMAGQNPLTVGLSTLTPSFDDMEVGERAIYAWSANPVLSPFIQTGLNRDYKGEKFYGEPIVDQGRPRNYYDWNKHSFGHSVAKLLNDVTGGNDAVPGFINIQGAAIDLFLSSYLGGYGDFASKTLDTGKNAGELLFGDGKVEEYGKEKEIGLADVISDLPVAYRFAKAPIEVYGEIGVKDHVVRLKNKANEWGRQIVNQYKDGYIEEAQEMLQDGNGSGSAQDYYLSIGRSKIYEWSKDIPNAKTLYEDMMGETYHNGEYSTLGQAAIIIGQAEMFSSLIKGNFDDLENPNDASYLYEDIKKYYLPTMKEILKEAEPEEANAEIEAIAQEIVDYYNELGNPTPHTKDTKLYKEDE